MIAYKGFNKDMTCRDIKFEEGKIYKTEEARLCKAGFHACENPLDCFVYYEPSKSVYREVELDDVSDEREKDSKIVGKRIKIGAALDVAAFCKAHFEYVKKRTTKSKQGSDNTNLSAQDGSSLAAQDWSSLAARDRSSLAARNVSSLAARDGSSLAAQDWSSLAAQDWSSLAVQDMSSLAAQDWSSLAARDRSSLAARNGSSLAAQDGSSLAAQDMSSLVARNGSSLAARDGSSLAAGEHSVLAAFNSAARAGLGSLIALAYHEIKNGEYVVTDFAAAIVDGKVILPDVWYRLDNGKLVKAEEERSV